MHVHPVIAVLVIPGLAVLALCALPYIQHDAEPSGRWFSSGRGRRLAGAGALLALVFTPAAIYLDERLTRAEALNPDTSPLLVRGVAPLAVVLLVTAGFYFFSRKRLAAPRAEAVQALFSFFFVGLCVLTVVGVWFRGEGMALIWPWGG